MTRILLSRLNGVFLMLLGLLAIAIQSSLFSTWPLTYIKPDAALWLVMWFALRRPFIEGGILTLVMAYFQELHSSAPSGVLLAKYLFIYLGTAGANQVLVIPNFESFAMVTGVTAALSQWFQLLILALLGVFTDSSTGWGWKGALILTLPQAAIQAGLSIWIYPTLERFDLLTYKQARPEMELL